MPSSYRSGRVEGGDAALSAVWLLAIVAIAGALFTLGLILAPEDRDPVLAPSGVGVNCARPGFHRECQQPLRPARR